MAKKKKRKTTTKKVVSATEASEVLAKDAQERSKRCKERVDQVMEEERCQLVPSIQGDAVNGVRWGVAIVALPTAQAQP